MYEKTIHLKSFKATFILIQDDFYLVFVGVYSILPNNSLYIDTVLAKPKYRASEISA